TVGDFRQLVATLVTEDPARPDAPRSEVLEQFMSQPHPKLARLHMVRSAGGKEMVPRLWPDVQHQILAGRLEMVTGTEGEQLAPKIRAVPLENGNSELGELLIDWRDLTFADGTARDIADRLLSGSWSYHDQRTIVWNRGED